MPLRVTMLTWAPPACAELRAVGVAMDLELVDGVHRRVDEYRPVRADVVVVGPVHGPEVRRHGAPADREVGSAEEALVLHVEEVGSADSGHQGRELKEVAAVQGQLAHLLAVDESGHLAADRLHGDRGDLDAHGLRDLSGLELHVDRADVRDVEDDVASDGRLEAVQLHFDVVGAHGEVGEGIRPRSVGRDGVAKAGVLAGNGNFGALHDRVGRIRYGSPQARREPLGEGRHRKEAGDSGQATKAFHHQSFLF